MSLRGAISIRRKKRNRKRSEERRQYSLRASTYFALTAARELPKQQDYRHTRHTEGRVCSQDAWREAEQHGKPNAIKRLRIKLLGKNYILPPAVFMILQEEKQADPTPESYISNVNSDRRDHLRKWKAEA